MGPSVTIRLAESRWVVIWRLRSWEMVRSEVLSLVLVVVLCLGCCFGLLLLLVESVKFSEVMGFLVLKSRRFCRPC